MKKILAILVFALSLSPIPSFAAQLTATVGVVTITSQLQLFASETAAQKHCPRDQVVWLNTRSGIYHEKGMRWYGATKEGAYVCRKEADAASDRDTRNGQ